MGLSKAVQVFFFEAMRNGWASGIKGSEVRGMPNHRRIEFPDPKGRFLLEERYEVSTDLESQLQLRLSGSIIIFSHEVEVWSMTYKGKYKKDALPLLRLALMQNYKANIFVGGRGPFELTESETRKPGELVYENKPSLLPEKFGDPFRGDERIYRIPLQGVIEIVLGTYHYSGWGIIPRLD